MTGSTLTSSLSPAYAGGILTAKKAPPASALSKQESEKVVNEGLGEIDIDTPHGCVR